MFVAVSHCRPVPVDPATEAGRIDAELSVCEPAVYGVDSSPGSLPPTPPTLPPSQPHSRLPAHRQVAHSGIKSLIYIFISLFKPLFPVPEQ